jgi:hypothetical protein
VATSNEAELTVNPRTYALTITTNAGGTTNPSPATYTYTEGTNVQVTTIPNTNYKSAYWELDGSNVGSDNPITVLMNSNHTLKAYFTLITYSLTITTTTGGTPIPAPGTYTYPSGSYASVTAFPSANYLFNNWILDSSPAGSANPISVLMNSNHTLQAVFSIINYALTITASEGGTTTPPPGTSVYASGSYAQATAIPSANYKFIKWLLDSNDSGSANPISVLMNSNHTLQAVFQLLTYRLNVMNSTGGTTNPAPGIHIYVNGTEVSVTATPDAYYMLDYWLRDGNNAGLANPATVLMTDDHAIQPVFAKINYTLKIETPTGGNTNPAPGTHTYPAGTTVEVTATQDAGYRFDHWGLGGASAGSANPISISMDTNHRLEAVFIETHTLTITSSGDGTTNPPPGTYTYGVPTNVTVTALPNTSYLFDHWELDSANTGTTNPYTVTMSCNHTLNAMFARVNYTLILSTTAGGSICPVPGSYTYAKGSIVQINETASAGYQFDHWTLDGTNAGSNSSLNVLVDNDHTLQATFARIVKLTITSATGGTTTPSAGVYSYMQGTSAQVNASPNANYVLTGWLLDGAQVNVTGQITVLMDSNHTLQPTFALLNFTLTVSATSGGTTNPTPGTRTYVNGTSVLVSATASSGYGFDHWVLDGIGAGSTPSISVLVNNNHTLQATFARIVKLTITAATGGKTIPSAGVYNYLQGSSAQVNASPNANYVLTGWLKDKVKVNVPGQITILMDSNHAVQPIFTQITFT